MDRRKEDAVLHVSSRARSENGGGETFQRLALRRSGSMDWCGEGIERRMFHGCFARIRKRSRALRLKKERVGECQGGESNSRPTPKAFGAAATAANGKSRRSDFSCASKDAPLFEL